MGVWNQTCMVTQLPITAGEPVRMILMRQLRHTEFNYCYPGDGWRPVGLPIVGRYDEYGSIEGVDTSRPEVALTLQILGNHLGRSFSQVDFATTEEKRNLGHFLWSHSFFIPSTTEPSHWVWYDTGRGGLDEEGQPVGDRSHQARSYGFALVKEEAYQRMIALVERGRRQYVQQLARGDEDESFWQVQNFLYTKIDGGDVLSENVKRLVEPLADFLAFFDALDYARRQFVPQSGQGSQDDDWQFHLEVAQIAVDLATEEIKAAKRREEEEAQDEDYGDDENEEEENTEDA